MKGLHGGIPLAVLAAVARAHADAIGGAHGLDSGNAGGVSTDNDFARANAEVNKDDHHVDVKTETKVDVDVGPHPDPYWHHWRPDSPPHWRKARGHGGDTLIAGPGGVDSGNSASIPTKNEFASLYDEKNKDDHSGHAKAEADVDVDNWGLWRRNNHDGHEHHHGDGPHHEERPHHEEKHHHERPHDEEGPTTLIGGPGGVDSGNSASIPTKNEFASLYDEKNKDDHSGHAKAEANVDVDNWGLWRRNNHDGHEHHHGDRPHHEERPHHGEKHHHERPHDEEGPTTLIGGPGGVDSGNSASVPTENEFASIYDEKNKDDHSVDVDNKWKYEYDVHGHPYPVPVPGVFPLKARRSGRTLIGGPGGIDSGNSASIPTDNEFASIYDEKNKDDHSVDVDNKWKYEYDVHGHPYPVPVPGHPWKRDPSHRHQPATLIGGSHGVDSGNSASIPTENEFASLYKEHNHDDHSVDVDQKYGFEYDNRPAPFPVPVPGPPHHWKARNGRGSGIGGPGGVDTGNSASIPTENDFGGGYSETNIDDHAVDIDQKTNVDIDHEYPYPVPVPVHPHWPHHLKARQHGNTAIDGSKGVDRGNDASIPTNSQFGAAYKEHDKDDHSVHVDSKTNVDVDSHPYPVPVPVPGHHHHWKARSHHSDPEDTTLIDGPGGIDTGNDADISSTNTFLSDYDELNKDDHSFTGKAAADLDIDYDIPFPVPVPAHFWKARGQHGPPVTLIGGPNGIDTGNNADAGNVNSVLSDYDEFNKDDHSVDEKTKAKYDIDYRRSLHGQVERDLINGAGGADSGNGFSAPTSNHANTAYDEDNEDDHSVGLAQETDVDVDQEYPYPVPVPVPEPQHPHPEPHHEHHPEPHHEHHPEPHHEHHPEPHHEVHPGRPAPGPAHDAETDPNPAPGPFNAPSADIQLPQEAPKADPAPEPVSQPKPHGQESQPTPPSFNLPAAEPTMPQDAPSGNFKAPQPAPESFPQGQQMQPSVPSAAFQGPAANENPEDSDTNETSEASNDEPEADDNSEDSVETSESPAPVPPFNPQASNTQNGFQGFGQDLEQGAGMAMPSFNPSASNTQNGLQGFGQGFGQGSAMAMPSFNPSTTNRQNGIPQGFGQGAGGAPAPSSPFGNQGFPPSQGAFGSQSQNAPAAPGSHSPMTSTVVVPRASSFERIPIDVPQSQTGPSAHASSARTVVVHTTDDSAPTSSVASTGAPITSRAETVFTGGAAQFTPHAGVFSVVCGVAALLAFVL